MSWWSGLRARLLLFPRREAACELAQSEMRLRRLNELSSDWYWEQDERFRFTVFLGGRGLASTYPPADLIGKTRWEYPAFNMIEADWDRHRAQLQAHQPFAGLEMQRTGGAEPIWVSVSGEPIFDERGKFTGYRGVGSVITERKRNEEQLRTSEERFRTLVNAAPMLVWMSGTDKLCTYFNRMWLEFRGRTQEQECGNGWVEGVHPEDVRRCMSVYVTAFEARREFEMEYRLQRHDGVHRWILDRGAPFFDPAGAFLGYVGSCIDITERKRADEDRLRLEREIMQMDDAQQRRIGRELHDGLGQQLTSIALMAKVLEHKLRDGGGKAGEAKRIVEAVNQATSLTRALSRGLNPVDMVESGLMAALEQMAGTVSSRVGVKCSFRCEEPVLVHDNAVAAHLYRIAQEALNNALKHSRAKRIDIGLQAGAGGPRLSVSDDGVGFDAEGSGRGRGMGLEIMRYRAEAIGGTMEIRARKPSGTVVSVTLAGAAREQAA